MINENPVCVGVVFFLWILNVIYLSDKAYEDVRNASFIKSSSFKERNVMSNVRNLKTCLIINCQNTEWAKKYQLILFRHNSAVTVLRQFLPEADGKMGGGERDMHEELSWCIFRTFQVSRHLIRAGCPS